MKRNPNSEDIVRYADMLAAMTRAAPAMSHDTYTDEFLKSTLARVIAGIEPASKGAIRIKGRDVAIRKPSDAIRATSSPAAFSVKVTSSIRSGRTAPVAIA